MLRNAIAEMIGQ